jgi:6-phosphofructokinase
VVGVPVTLNGDLKNQFVETNVGFDTICKVWPSVPHRTYGGFGFWQ